METRRGGRETYVVSLPLVMTSVACLVEGFHARAHPPGRLQGYFMYSLWKDQVLIQQEGPPPLPRFPNYIMHIPAEKLIWHQSTDRCNRSTDMRLQKRKVEVSQKTGEMYFSMYDQEDEPLMEGLAQFQYIGRTLEHAYNKFPEVHRNIGKVW